MENIRQGVKESILNKCNGWHNDLKFIKILHIISIHIVMLWISVVIIAILLCTNLFEIIP